MSCSFQLLSRVNCHPYQRLPNSLNVSFPGIIVRDLLRAAEPAMSEDRKLRVRFLTGVLLRVSHQVSVRRAETCVGRLQRVRTASVAERQT